MLFTLYRTKKPAALHARISFSFRELAAFRHLSPGEACKVQTGCSGVIYVCLGESARVKYLPEGTMLVMIPSSFLDLAQGNPSKRIPLGVSVGFTNPLLGIVKPERVQIEIACDSAEALLQFDSLASTNLEKRLASN